VVLLMSNVEGHMPVGTVLLVSFCRRGSLDATTTAVPYTTIDLPMWFTGGSSVAGRAFIARRHAVRSSATDDQVAAGMHFRARAAVKQQAASSGRTSFWGRRVDGGAERGVLVFAEAIGAAASALDTGTSPRPTSVPVGSFQLAAAAFSFSKTTRRSARLGALPPTPPLPACPPPRASPRWSRKAAGPSCCRAGRWLVAACVAVL
jgi:hypothetical protein